MSDLDKYFQKNVQGTGHPKLKYWIGLREKQEVEKAQFELKRDRDGLTFRPAKIYLHFRRNDGSDANCENDDWDTDLNVSLIEMNIRAITVNNEKERFGLMLKELLEKPEIRFGDGFFNAVLVDMLKNSGFGIKGEVIETLGKIYMPTPNKDGHAHSTCLEMIEGVFIKCGQYLKTNLDYDQTVAEEILSGAIAYYLDERFSITNRKLLGFD